VLGGGDRRLTGEQCLMIKRWAWWVLFAVLSIAALISSLGTAFQMLPLNPDMAEMALIYQGIVHHGWRFPFTWRFNQDNQFLSLLPFALIYYAVAGISGAAIVVQGWLIFVVNCVFSGFLARVLTESWKVGWLVFVTTLLANPFAIGQPGILAYPVSHNSVWTFGLIGIIAIITYIKKRFSRSLLILTLVVFLGTVSDPWFQATFTLPSILLLWRLSKSVPDQRIELIKAMRLIILSWFIGRITYSIGAYYGMFSSQSISFSSLSIMERHVTLLFDGIGTFFSILPLPTNFVSWTALLIFSCSMPVVTYFTALNRKSLTTEQKAFFMFTLYSITTLCVLFVVTGFATGKWAVEYLISAYYLIILDAVIAFRISYSKNLMLRICLYASVSAYLILCVSSIENVGWSYSPKWGSTKQLVNFLENNHLHFGYGSYFGAQSPLFGLASNNRVIGRHISQSGGALVISMGNGDDDFWYDRSDITIKPQFIVFSRGDSPLIPLATNEFGKPEKKLNFLTYRIYVYNRNLLPKLLRNRFLSKLEWEKMNTERNIKGIINVCKSLGIDPNIIIRAYLGLVRP
jgi:hypothetical protein